MHRLWIRKVDKFVPQIPIDFARLYTGIKKNMDKIIPGFLQILLRKLVKQDRFSNKKSQKSQF